LILLAVLDSFLTTTLSGKTFVRFITICLVNITVAMTIGLTILNAFHPGLAWRGHIGSPDRARGGACSLAAARRRHARSA
jgi:Na+/H+-dicarboxylate symporter